MAREIKPITWHYTHRNLLPQIIWRESKHKHISSFDHSWDGSLEGVREDMSEESHWVREREGGGKRERECNKGRNKIETRVSWGRYSERESGKLRWWARVVELSACFLPCTRPRPHVRESPSLNLAETRGFPQQRRASLFIVG